MNDAVGTVTDACEPLPAQSLAGLIAVVDRGTCTFVTKVATVQAAGAIGMIVANNVAGDPSVMGGSSRGVRIPAVMVSQADGATLKGLAPASGTMRRLAVQPIQIDSALDSDVVYHEYGHGLTWRMIGGMSGPLAGAIGEGASDAVSLLVNGDDVVGEHSASDPAGIRRFPYDRYPLTYADMIAGEVHADGELFGAILWRLSEDFKGQLSTEDLFTTFVDGMTFTPVTPAYEDMREGMLASADARGESSQTCVIWDALADFGVGVGANGVVNADGTVTITESFVKPAAC